MNLQKMMKQAQEMQSKMADMQAKMETEEVEGSSGGGMVKLRMTGKHKVKKVEIDESLLKSEEKEVLEDLLVAAFNDASDKVESTFSDQMSKMTSGLNLPAGFKLPF